MESKFYKHLKNQIKTLNKYLPRTADGATQEGIHYLIKASQHKYLDRNDLQLACDSLVRAREYSSKKYFSYLGLGFLWLLLVDRKNSTQYLELASQNSEAESKTLDLLTTTIEKVGIFTSYTPNRYDYDLYYDYIDLEIFRLLIYLKDNATEIDHIVIRESDIQLIEEFKISIDKPYKKLNEGLEWLDQEIEVIDLIQDLRPIELYLKHIEEVLALSREFSQLKKQIDKVMKNSLQLIQNLNQLKEDPIGSSTIEKAMNQIMDDFDFIDDKFNDYQMENKDVSLLTPHHKELVQCIEFLQYQLDLL